MMQTKALSDADKPTFNWGWNNTFNYKNFDFSFFVVGFHGFDIYNATHQMGYNLIKSQQMAGVTLCASC